MKIRIHVFVAVMAVAAGLLASPVAAESEPKNEDQTTKLTELLEQRRHTLEKLVAIATEEYRQGISGYRPVARATEKLIDAELELAKGREERLALLQRRVEVLQTLYSMTETMAEAAQATPSDRLAARAGLLEAKIELAREQLESDDAEQ